MKKTNKGFSLVELIIVIAIMAILAGALAPALIKYINKSRLSTDVQTASSIATACQAAISSEKGYDDAVTYYSGKVQKLSAFTYNQPATDTCSKVIKETCGANAPVPKGKKCLGETSTGKCTKTYGNEFEISIDPDANAIKITTGNGQHTLYPTADECITG